MFRLSFFAPSKKQIKEDERAKLKAGIQKLEAGFIPDLNPEPTLFGLLLDRTAQATAALLSVLNADVLTILLPYIADDRVNAMNLRNKKDELERLEYNLGEANNNEEEPLQPRRRFLL